MFPGIPPPISALAGEVPRALTACSTWSRSSLAAVGVEAIDE